jgi:lysylphosphatidylglycerol synthetase-like protein (DUF2156 family)
VSPDGSAPLVERVAGAIAWRVFVSTAYTTGLTLLIPFVAVRIQPAELKLVPFGMSPILLWLAIGLMVSALIVRLCVTRSLSGTLKALGLMTFLPGFLGIVCALFGRDILSVASRRRSSAFRKSGRPSSCTSTGSCPRWSI